MDKYKNRLLEEWKQHGKICIGLDFDDAISPWKFKTEEDIAFYEKVINLVKECCNTGAYVTIHTSCNVDRYKEIQEYCESHLLVISSINKNAIEGLPYGKEGSKPQCNIYIDDRAGINEALEILEWSLYQYRSYLQQQKPATDVA